MCRARDAITGSRLSQQQRRGSNFLNFLNFRGIRNGGMFAGAGRDWPDRAAADDLRFADRDAGTMRSLVPRDDTSLGQCRGFRATLLPVSPAHSSGVLPPEQLEIDIVSGRNRLWIS